MVIEKRPTNEELLIKRHAIIPLGVELMDDIARDELQSEGVTRTILKPLTRARVFGQKLPELRLGIGIISSVVLKNRDLLNKCNIGSLFDEEHNEDIKECFVESIVSKAMTSQDEIKEMSRKRATPVPSKQEDLESVLDISARLLVEHVEAVVKKRKNTTSDFINDVIG